jgi:hypothetical protein
VASYSLSGEADADIEAIAQASLRQWGLARGEKYVLEPRVNPFNGWRRFQTLGAT